MPVLQHSFVAAHAAMHSASEVARGDDAGGGGVGDGGDATGGADSAGAAVRGQNRALQPTTRVDTYMLGSESRVHTYTTDGVVYASIVRPIEEEEQQTAARSNDHSTRQLAGAGNLVEV